jgi:hypothetical protein
MTGDEEMLQLVEDTGKFPVIDATKALWPAGTCPMFMAVAMKEAA